MLKVHKRTLLASILILVTLITGAWRGDRVVLAASQVDGVPETPLYPGLAWNDMGSTVQEIRINVNGDAVSVAGHRFEAAETFIAGLPPEVLDYYSNEQLASAGWTSYDAYETAEGLHYIFEHASGVYLAVEYLKCPDAPQSSCIAIWQSEPVDLSALESATVLEPENLTATVGAFSKKTPVNGATNVNPANVVLSWETYTPTPDKYSYCIKIDSACSASDPNWTSSYSTSVTLPTLANDKLYYWQVKAITCVTCVPKTFVYANNGTFWTFRTRAANRVIIVGNAGVSGAVLSYMDGTLKSVTADNYGSYLISVPINWSGTITPAKAGFLFSPRNASFTNLTAPQTIQNFTAIPAHTISGNVGLSGVTLSYIEGTLQTVTSNSNGHYAILVPPNWSGTVTPSKTGFTFSPPSRTYSNVTSNQTGQHYTPLVNISGSAGVGGATLSYVDGTPKAVTADGSGAYSIDVPRGWSGTVTPSKIGFTFVPANRSYTNVTGNQTSQNYTAIDDPIVLSSVRLNESPTSAPSVSFTVTFSETVTGVDINDFVLTTTGLTGAGVTGVSGSDAVYTVTIDTGSGSGTARLDVVDDDSIVDGANNHLGGVGAGNGNFTAGEVYEVNQATLLSISNADGWVLESSETSGVGGTLNKTATTLRVGDDASNRQYRTILSFNTANLPDNAVITSVTLRFKFAGFAGTNPFNTHYELLADVCEGAFRGNPALQLADFYAGCPTSLYKAKVLTYTNSPVDSWFSQTFLPEDFQFVNLGGVTQFRLRFRRDDNNDFGADFLKLYSGNVAESANRPQLVIEYNIP